MLTKNEITSLNLSPTKKDFVQIWNELLEVAGKLSERWDPTSTNESDPGIVILKALTGIADKLNYNIDKNTLEAFMPTAAQEDSMRKLCDMLGYTMKYYQSAETDVTIKYYNANPDTDESDQMDITKGGGLIIPKFTVITNSDQDISYFTTDAVNSSYGISSQSPSVTITCMEGQIVKCESINDNNIITSVQVSENNRFYLPETQIAENGIFIYNVKSDIYSTTGFGDGEKWLKVDNLNTQARGAKVFKFGYDSYESRPYIEFPEGYSELFNEGIFIYYARTNGVNGNISARALTQLELPTGGGWDKVTAESFRVENTFAATSGSNAETIKQAYNNFKKTIGTFETLVTCRDYMNKIYSMTAGGKPLVSNILVTDIRNDLNRAVTICSCDDAGIFYKDKTLTASTKIIDNVAGDSMQTGLSYTDYKQVGEPQFSDYVVNEELTIVSEPKRISEKITEHLVASEANRPFYYDYASTTPYFVLDTDPDSGIETGSYITRSTNWYLGSEYNLIPMYSDQYSSNIVSEVHMATFNSSMAGTVSAFAIDGSRSSVWLIKQGDVIYETLLPINWVTSTETIITNQQTETVKEQRTCTIEKQRTKTVENTIISKEIVEEDNAIDHFDLIFYPFKSYNQIRNNVKDIRAVYDASFTYSDKNLGDITTALESDSVRTISHNIKTPRIGDLVSINNYLRLSATIATNSKVTAEEEAIIIDNIKVALANAFNMRELDFGEEIPFDSIVDTIENADSRIRVASLNEPALYTTFSVLEENASGIGTEVVEYAVASDWLDIEMADSTGRLAKTDTNNKTISTFDTTAAREIYNKLVLRNVLAGRVPLFNYNDTFDTSFSEGAYQVTTEVTKKPAALKEPNETDKYTIWTDDGVTYTGQFFGDGTPNLYTETRVPEAYRDNIMSETNDADGNITDYITDITASCKLLVDEYNTITDVTLAGGEYVKFRAPNFTTIKTYPAYVNYCLDLASNAIQTNAAPAKATSLFEVLNTDEKREKVLAYFSDLDIANSTSFKKTFSIEQEVSAYKKEDTITIQTGELNTIIGINVNNTQEEDKKYTPESLMALSGWIKLTNADNKARVHWTPKEGESEPNVALPEIILEKFTSPFITNVNVLTEIKAAIDTALATYRDKLPTQCSFTVSLDFECVPFEASSLQAWETFIRTCASKYNEDYEYQVLSYLPVDENNSAIFWRLFGDGYEVGKYVTERTEKLLKFDTNYFGLLPSSYTSGIYLIEDIGIDAKPVVIANDAEYKLRKNEWLYVEYTPSSTTGDNTTKNQASVTEVYGEGTIIRPSGFEAGLIDSSVLDSTPVKTISFVSGGNNITQKAMHSLGANEQIEIRDFAKVELSHETFNNASAVYIYKNFNGCPELEATDGPRTYTLKDGEYIFYTDASKAEFAYFTSGTQVTMSGNAKLPEFEIIELATIFEAGINEIPWAYLRFEKNDKITFQEYQYITLGQEDTLKSLVLLDAAVEKDKNGNVIKKYLDDSWQYCSDVIYTVAGDPDTKIELPEINLNNTGHGNGWEVCSILTLNASADTTQTLRSTNKVENSIILTRTSATGGAVKEVIEPKQGIDSTVKQSLSFKTNLTCQACGSIASIQEVYNPNNIKSFQLKLFATDAPVIVETAPGRVTPRVDSSITDITNWPGMPLEATDYTELWSKVDLSKIKPDADGDNALRLPISLLPNTFGVFCIYIYSTSTAINPKAKVWLEVVPGTRIEDITLLSANNTIVETYDEDQTKLSRIYLRQGINCICVNKTGRLFVKASEEAQGTLYFDKLRLVNSQVIQYTDADKNTLVFNTKGLNLNQLGYLDTTTPDDTKLDSRTKARMRAGNAAAAYTQMDDQVNKTEDAIVAGYNTLSELSTKVQKVVDEEKLLSEDLKAIASFDDSRLSDLVDAYKQISETLRAEQELQQALNNNKKADDLERELVTLLDGFSSTTASEQQILDELSEIKNKAITAGKNLSEDEIIEDYHKFIENSLNNTKTAIMFDKIKSVAKEKIEQDYSDKLDTLADSLTQVVNLDSRTKLQTVLTGLRDKELANAQAELSTLINKLNDIVAQDSTNDLISRMVKAAAAPDYIELYALLTELDLQLGSRDIAAIVAEISAIGYQDGSEQLFNLVAELKELVNSINTTIGSGTSGGTINASTGTNSLRSVLAAIQTKVANKLAAEDSTEVDVAIIEDIQAFSNKVTVEYKAKLLALITSLDACLDELQEGSDITDALENLADNADSNVIDVLMNLEQIVDTRSEYRELVDSLDSANAAVDDSISQFITEAVKEVWPAYLLTRLTKALNEIDFVFTAALSDSLEAFAGNEEKLNSALDSIANPERTGTLLTILNAKAVKEHFTKIETLLSRAEQQEKNTGLIMRLGGLIQNSTELTRALNMTHENSIISALIADWQAATNIIVKGQIQAALKDELDTVIKIDEQIYNVVTDLLGPNIFRLEHELKELVDAGDAFYSELLKEVLNIKKALLGKTIKGYSLVDDSEYDKLFKLPLTDFMTGITKFDTSAKSLLPKSVTEAVGGLTDTASVLAEQTADVTYLKAQPLATMTTEALNRIVIKNSNISGIVSWLIEEFDKIDLKDEIDPGYEEAFKILRLEEQLLEDIKKVDTGNNFYYSVPVEDHLAIDLNESDKKLNTLMNPSTNYDINNINNSFVISKLDIDYLDSGIKIARSSKLN